MMFITPLLSFNNISSWRSVLLVEETGVNPTIILSRPRRPQNCGRTRFIVCTNSLEVVTFFSF